MGPGEGNWACSNAAPSSLDDRLLVDFFGEDTGITLSSCSSLVDSSTLLDSSMLFDSFLVSFLGDALLSFRGAGAGIWVLCLHWSTLTSLVDCPTLLLGCVPHGLICFLPATLPVVEVDSDSDSTGFWEDGDVVCWEGVSSWEEGEGSDCDFVTMPGG